jgi:tRNA(Ile)-lysidine synthase
MGSRTLHGCLISKGAATAAVMREYSAISDVKPIEPGDTMMWDGRWQVSLFPECEMKKLVIRALGTLTHDEIDRLCPGLRRRVPKGRARAALPALWQGERPVLVPDIAGSPGALAHAQVINKPEMQL